MHILVRGEKILCEVRLSHAERKDSILAWQIFFVSRCNFLTRWARYSSWGLVIL